MLFSNSHEKVGGNEQTLNVDGFKEDLVAVLVFSGWNGWRLTKKEVVCQRDRD